MMGLSTVKRIKKQAACKGRSEALDKAHLDIAMDEALPVQMAQRLRPLESAASMRRRAASVGYRAERHP